MGEQQQLNPRTWTGWLLKPTPRAQASRPATHNQQCVSVRQPHTHQTNGHSPDHHGARTYDATTRTADTSSTLVPVWFETLPTTATCWPTRLPAPIMVPVTRRVGTAAAAAGAAGASSIVSVGSLITGCSCKRRDHEALQLDGDSRVSVGTCWSAPKVNQFLAED